MCIGVNTSPNFSFSVCLGFKHESTSSNNSFGLSDKHCNDNLKFKDTSYVIDFLSIYARLILIKGNHDTILEPIAKKKNIEVKNYFKIGDVFLCHGHRILENKEIESSKVIIIGHEHPAVGLKEGSRVEKFKCFLKGKFDDKILIVQPSTNLITIGTNVLTEKLLSPYLDQNLINFEVYVVADEIMYFGKIKNLI